MGQWQNNGGYKGRNNVKLLGRTMGEQFGEQWERQWKRQWVENGGKWRNTSGNNKETIGKLVRGKWGKQ